LSASVQLLPGFGSPESAVGVLRQFPLSFSVIEGQLHPELPGSSPKTRPTPAARATPGNDSRTADFLDGTGFYIILLQWAKTQMSALAV
ncbi:hypothetical protein XENOCAPTIV_030064, partial [Xenoophorus captivus]